MARLADKNVLVTGGAGFIGSHLVDRLIEERPGKIIVIDNLFLGQKSNLEGAYKTFPRLIFYKQNAAQFAALKAIFAREKVDVVINCAMVPLPTSLAYPRFAIENNIAITTNICELLKDGYYQYLVHFSSSEVYGSARYFPMDEAHPLGPQTPYAASKAACDHIVQSFAATFGLNVTLVRPFNTYGPRQNWRKYAALIPQVLRRIIRGQEIEIYGDGRQTRDFVFVDDVVRASIDICKNPRTYGKIINIASGREIAIGKTVSMITRIFGISPKIIYRQARPGDVRRHQGSIKLAEKLIVFRPKVNFEEGIVKTIEWYKQNLK